MTHSELARQSKLYTQQQRMRDAATGKYWLQASALAVERSNSGAVLPCKQGLTALADSMMLSQTARAFMRASGSALGKLFCSTVAS